jgi:hypothetical protein
MGNRGIIAFVVIIAILIVAWYLYNHWNSVGSKGLITVPTSIPVSTVPVTVSPTGTTTVAPVNITQNCNQFLLQGTGYNKTLQSSCSSEGEVLGVWVSGGITNSEKLLIVGADGITYVNQSSGDVCPTFYKSVALPPQDYFITLQTGPGGGTGSCQPALVKINTTVVTQSKVYNYVFNGDFANGTYSGWNTTGNGFGKQPINITYANANHCYTSAPWTGYPANSFFASTYTCGLSTSPGNLTSSPFIVSKSFLNFKIVSPQDQSMYVEILYNNTPSIVVHYNTFNSSLGQNASSTFQNGTIILTRLLGKVVQIRVVAGTLVRQRFIAIGDFSLSTSASNYNPSIIVNESVT